MGHTNNPNISFFMLSTLNIFLFRENQDEMFNAQNLSSWLVDILTFKSELYLIIFALNELNKGANVKVWWTPNTPLPKPIIESLRSHGKNRILKKASITSQLVLNVAKYASQFRMKTL